MTIKYILTRHAREQLIDRNISEQLLVETLRSPTQIRTDGDGKLLFIKWYRQDNKPRLLLVVAVPETDRFRVITIIDTSKVQKYLRET